MPVRLPSSLVRHLRDGRCVLFVGAGLSAAAGLPDWKSLLESMVTEIENDGAADEGAAELRALIEGGKLLDVADHCRQRLGERRYQELLGEKLRGGSGDIPEIHRFVTQLPFSAIVTTNYDKLLERAYSRFRGELPKVVTSRDRETLGSLLFSGGFFILKAHGDIDDAASLVLTARDYRNIIHSNPAFDALFSALLMTRCLLFIGYSLADPDFRLLLDRQLSIFGENIPERYALMAGVGVVEADIMKRSANIKVLAYPAGQHSEVPLFLQGLLAQLEADSTRANTSLPSTDSVVSPAKAVQVSERRRSVLAPDLAASAERSGAVGGPGDHAHLPLRLPNARLRIALRNDRLECQLSVEDVRSVYPGDPVSWPSLYRRISDLLSEQETKQRPRSYAHLGRLLGNLLPADLSAKLPSGHVLTLQVERELADIPWELAIIGDAEAPLALTHRTVREVGNDALSRGLPGIHTPVRALIIGDPPASAMFHQLDGAYHEALEIAELYRAHGRTDCHVVVREHATLDAVVDALSTHAYDVIHFAGHAWFDPHESFLSFGEDSGPTSSELRTLLGSHPPAILFLNSHYTSFLPRGLRPRQMHEQVTENTGQPPGILDLRRWRYRLESGHSSDVSSRRKTTRRGCLVRESQRTAERVTDSRCGRQARSDTLAARSDDVSALRGTKRPPGLLPAQYRLG